MDLKEERNMILDMVAEGRITVDDAKQLLDALEKSARKREVEDEFFTSAGMDFHIPEVHIPNMGNIVNRAFRHARPKISGHFTDLEGVREDMEDELERLRDQLNALKEESARITEELKKKPGQPTRHEEDWTA